MLTVLRRRNFALVWLGGLASLTGDWALFAGLPLAVYQMTGSTLALGLTAIASSVPRLLLLVLCCIVESSVGQFYKPAEGALLPRLVPSEDLVAANALNSLNTNIT